MPKPSQPDKRTHYEVLGVSESADDKKIAEALKMRRRECRNDEHEFKKVNGAGNVLLDAALRRAYDINRDLEKRREQYRGTGGQGRQSNANQGYTSHGKHHGGANGHRHASHQWSRNEALAYAVIVLFLGGVFSLGIGRLLVDFFDLNIHFSHLASDVFGPNVTLSGRMLAYIFSLLCTVFLFCWWSWYYESRIPIRLTVKHRIRYFALLVMYIPFSMVGGAIKAAIWEFFEYTLDSDWLSVGQSFLLFSVLQYILFYSRLKAKFPIGVVADRLRRYIVCSVQFSIFVGLILGLIVAGIWNFIEYAFGFNWLNGGESILLFSMFFYVVFDLEAWYERYSESWANEHTLD